MKPILVKPQSPQRNQTPNIVMKKIVALAFFFLSILQLKAQDSFNCDSLIKKHYKISDLKDNSHFLEEVKATILCKYDSLDMHILMGPNGDLPFTVLAPLAVERIGTSNEDKVLMSEIIQALSSIREMPHYEELRHKVAMFMQTKKTGISDQLYRNLPAKESKNQQTAENSHKQQIVERHTDIQIILKACQKQKNLGSPYCFTLVLMLLFQLESLMTTYYGILKFKKL